MSYYYKGMQTTDHAQIRIPPNEIMLRNKRYRNGGFIDITSFHIYSMFLWNRFISYARFGNEAAAWYFGSLMEQ
jgi:hypothetical protein